MESWLKSVKSNMHKISLLDFKNWVGGVEVADALVTHSTLKSLKIDGSIIAATGFANLAAGLRNLEEATVHNTSSACPDAAIVDDVCTFSETCT